MVKLVISKVLINMPINRKIKILYCITKSNWGGASRYVFDLATGLPKDKFDVSVVLGGNGVLAEKLVASGIRVICINTLERDVNIFRDYASFKTLVELFKKEKPNVVHLNSSKIGLMGAVAGKLAGVPKIFFTVHGWVFNEDGSALKKLALKFMSWINILLTTKTIIIDNYDYDCAKKWPFSKNKMEIIPNGIKEPKILERETARKTIFKKIGVLPASFKNKIVVGTIAELHKNKGLIFAMQGISMMSEQSAKKIIFVVIGEGDERNKLQTFIRNKGLENKIFLTGYMEGASKYLSAFDLFILPSTKEGLPYVLLEAGSAGLPIITTNVGGIPDIIDDGKTGILISPRNACEIKKALTSAIDNRFAFSIYSQKLQEKIKSEFSYESMLNKTVWVYYS